MSVANGQPVNAAITNAAFMSRTTDTTTTGSITQSNTTQSTDKDSGALVTEGGVGIEKNLNVGGTIKNADVTESTDKDTGSIVTEGGLGVEKNLNVGGNISSVGAINGSNLTGTNTGDVTLANIGAIPNADGASISGQTLTLQPASLLFGGVVTTSAQTFAGDKTFNDDVVIDGNLTVNGTTTTVNSNTLDVVDANITVNVGGNDATANGAGLTVDRTGTSGSLVYDENLASKFKLGDLGGESEILDVDSNQIINGIKTFDNKIELEKKLLGQQTVDNSTTGSNVSVDALTLNLKVTNATLTSIRDIASPEGTQTFVLTNGTGNSIDIINDNAAVTRIQTGTGADITLADGASLLFQYDNASTLWRVIGGSGGGSSFSLSAIGASPNANGATYSSGVFNLEPASASFGGVVTTGTQTFAGNKTFSGSISASNFSGTSSGTNSGDVTLTAIGGTPNSNGASLSGQALTLQPADSTNGGVLTAAAQDIGGAKTFKASVTHEIDTKFKSDNANLVTVKAPTGLSASYDLTLPPNDGSTDQFLKTDGAGVTSWQTITQEINYIENDGAEINTSGWVAFLDAANSRPTDGTGGTPSGNFALSRTTSSPLRGNASFRINNVGGASNQGEGYSYDFTIDSADQANVLQISFDYVLTSTTGSFQIGTSSQDSDVIVYIYDITNSVLIEPTSFKLDCGVFDVKLKYQSTFQTASNSTSYRLILYKATTTTAGFNFIFDNLSISPQVTTSGVPVSDWQSYSMTVSNLGTGSGTSFAKYRRVGDSLEVMFRFDKDASAGSGATAVTFSLPTGLTIDTTKVPSSSNGGTNFSGSLVFSSNAVAHTPAINASNYSAVSFYQSASGSFLDGTDFTANIIAVAAFRVPIAGWSSNVLVSSEADTRVVAYNSIGQLGTATITSTPSVVTLGTKQNDTHNAYNTSNGVYTVPVSGWYRLEGKVDVTSTTTAATNYVACSFLVNGSNRFENFTIIPSNLVTTVNAHTSGTIFVNAGGTISLATRANTTTPVMGTGIGGSFLCISRVSGISQISANESVAFRISRSATATNLFTSATVTKQTYDVAPEIDTHNAWNSANNRYIIPVSGTYEIYGSIMVSAVAVAHISNIRIRQNGNDRTQDTTAKESATSINYEYRTQIILRCLAGDYIELFWDNQSGSTLSSLGTSTAQVNRLIVKRIGNY